MPTASAVISDIVDISRDILKGISGRVPPRVRNEDSIEPIQLLPFDQILTNYYFRFSAVDRLAFSPGSPGFSVQMTSASLRSSRREESREERYL